MDPEGPKTYGSGSPTHMDPDLVTQPYLTDENAPGGGRGLLLLLVLVLGSGSILWPVCWTELAISIPVGVMPGITAMPDTQNTKIKLSNLCILPYVDK